MLFAGFVLFLVAVHSIPSLSQVFVNASSLREMNAVLKRDTLTALLEH